jgi:hypothetical protein
MIAGEQRGLRRILSDFREVWALVLFFAIDSIGAIPSLNSWLVANFGVTQANPAGIALSMLVYDGWANVLVLLIAAVAYVLGTDGLAQHERRRASKFFLLLAVASAVIGDLAWYFTGFYPALPVHGTSGVTMAAIGMTYPPTGMALGLTYLRYRKLEGTDRVAKKAWFRENGTEPYWGFVLSLVCLVVAFFAVIFVSGNLIVHGASFITAIMVSLGYWFMVYRKTTV